MTQTDAVIAARPGGPDVLTLVPRELPPPGPGQVLIEVEAAGVNRPDVLQRSGLYPPPEGASDVLGLEVAGRVSGLGEGVSDLAPGDEVMALLPGGGYARHALADAGSVLRKPKGLTFEEAAGFPETAFTVWANAFEAGGLKAGERLFVHGATSGIGTMAGQMAAAFGAEAWGTAGSPEKVKAALGHGYARAFDYRTEDWAEAARGEVDVVLDMVGGDYLARNLGLLREGGRHVSIAFLRGSEASVDVTAIMRRRLTLTGSTLRARPAPEKARLAGEIARAVLPHVGAGRIRPVIDSVFGLEDADAAHARMDEDHVGKVVLRCR